MSVSPAERIQQLTAELNHHNHLYYVEARPVISDQQFDLLLKELEALEEAHPELRHPDSPTLRVGGTITREFPTFRHRRPMMSLANTYSADELADFDRRVRQGIGREAEDVAYFCQLKIDGVALSLHYEDGVLVTGVTRGNGTEGDDITPNVRTIRSIPLRVPASAPARFEVRGEAYMSQADFDRLNAERAELGEPPLMNPRNTTAGTLKLQDSREVANRRLRFIAYYLFIEDGPQPRNDSEAIDLLRQWGFPVSDANEVAPSLAAVSTYIEHWRSRRDDLPYATDGVVVKVNDLPAREELGATNKAPRWAVAYKYAAEQAQTRLDHVSYQVGRTGYITPVANLVPVLLAGTTVKRASLYNYDEIRRLDLHIGDTVVVEKSGEIIPKVIEVVPGLRPVGAQPVATPTHCPECSTLLVQNTGEVGWYCPNEATCPPQIEGRLEHYASRKALDIQGLGTEVVHALVAAGLVRTPADLYDLTVEQVQQLERFARKSAENLVAGIKASAQVPYARVLYGLGIRFVGEGGAAKLAAAFPTVQQLMAASFEALVATPDVGERTARSVVDWCQRPENQQEIERLSAAGLQFEHVAAARASDKLAGKKILVSGTFPGWSRDDLKALIASHGGENASGISKNVDLFVVGEDAGPSKLEKATKLGVPVATLTDLLAMME